MMLVNKTGFTFRYKALHNDTTRHNTTSFVSLGWNYFCIPGQLILGKEDIYIHIWHITSLDMYTCIYRTMHATRAMWIGWLDAVIKTCSSLTFPLWRQRKSCIHVRHKASIDKHETNLKHSHIWQYEAWQKTKSYMYYKEAT